MKKESFYAVHSGAEPGIYSTWKECEAQVTGVSGAVYKKFGSKREAELFLKYGRAGTEIKNKTISKKKPPLEAAMAKKIQNAGVFGAGHDFALAPIISRSLAQVVEVPSNDSHKESVEVIYTDGSSRGNGKLGARAGVGVFFGEGDLRNVSERLIGQPQTNQRAELTAAIRALEKATPGKRIEIRTDSRYLINGIIKCVLVLTAYFYFLISF
ncbi:hypothetical protein DSO57_1005128 [Entomophthora muscae]|uniref:Uncharacterized protein n=1 Tax=Entomophthora muscae TaxID=34485 RepID=A0ACC2RZ23_9FUNG|nr:hypothetical protein DSO57_1005128 [Entomophthora muscae]